MNGVISTALGFLSHLHPLLVHLPIGGLVLLVALELLARWTKWKNAATNNELILGFVCVTAAASALSGWDLAREGGYDKSLLWWHQAAGFSLVAVCVVSVLLRHAGHLRAYRLFLALALGSLTITGHLGGSITHGRNFLTRGTLKKSEQAGLEKSIFSAVVQPILAQRCVECHGPEKHKADLRLDTLEALLKGGQDGPVILPGQAKESSLLQRILLPVDHDGHMPPEDQSQVTVQEIALLQWWINVGAPGNEKISDLKSEPKIRELLELVSKPSK